MTRWRETIYSYLETVLKTAAPTGPGCNRVERRRLFEELLTETKEGKIALPAAWVPPFGAIDTEVAEVFSPSGIVEARAIFSADAGATYYRRQWRRVDNCEWTPQILLCVKDFAAADAVLPKLRALLPGYITQTYTMARPDQAEDDVVALRAYIDWRTSGQVYMKNFQAQYVFWSIMIRFSYGIYALTDRLVKPFSVALAEPAA